MLNLSPELLDALTDVLDMVDETLGPDSVQHEAMTAVLDLAAVTTYATVDEVRDRWADASLDDTQLQSMLEAAHDQIVAYAPRLLPGVPVPRGYVEAEVLQVKNLGQAQLRDGDVLGYGDGYAVRVRPLGEDVKSLLRPRRAVPRVR